VRLDPEEAVKHYNPGVALFDYGRTRRRDGRVRGGRAAPAGPPSNGRGTAPLASRAEGRDALRFPEIFGISRIVSQVIANLQPSPPSLEANGTEAIMLSAMSFNVRRYKAGDTAAPSLGPREILAR